MAAVLLALLGAFCFGVLSVLTRAALRRAPDPAIGAFVTNAVAFVASAAVAAVAGVSLDDLRWSTVWPFVVAGTLAPGVSQILFVRAIRDVGASRASVVMGVAPIVSSALAMTFLDEPFRLPLLLGTLLVVAGVVSLAWDRSRPAHFRAVGLVLAFACALLFAVRDNVVRGAVDENELPALVAATVVLGAAALAVLTYLLAERRGSFLDGTRRAFLPFVPAGLAIGFAYDALTEAFARARVAIVAPLNATSALWGVLLSAVLLGRTEAVGRRLVLAAVLIVAGAAVVSATR